LVVAVVWAWVSQRLWVIHWIHTQLKLGLIWFPASGAHKDVDILSLNDEPLEFLQLVAKVTAVALGDCPFTRGEPIRHASPEILTRRDAQWRFLAVLISSLLPEFFVFSL
jgi:hypothetical protein